MSYAELHCHTNFSFLDGAAHADELVLRAAELGYEALAVTDHDGFRGVVKVHEAATKIGLPVVYGTEVGMPQGLDGPDPRSTTHDSRSTVREERARSPQSAARSSQPTAPSRRGRIRRMHGSKPVVVPSTDHLVLLAPSPRGYGEISQFIMRGQYRGEKDRPVYDYDELDEAARRGELVALTGCHQGAVPRAAANGDLEGALTAASHLREIFPDRLFIELWHHRMPDDDPRNDLLAEVGRRLACPRWPPTTCTTPIGATPTYRRCWQRSGAGGPSTWPTDSGRQQTSDISRTHRDVTSLCSLPRSRRACRRVGP